MYCRLYENLKLVRPTPSEYRKADIRKSGFQLSNSNSARNERRKPAFLIYIQQFNYISLAIILARHSNLRYKNCSSISLSSSGRFF